MDFARKQLEKYGWTDGKGLGKYENGISEALKPKLKRSVTGVGHDPASEFNEHWWTTLYNKAAGNVEVQNRNGKTKKIKTKDDNEFVITNSTWKLNRKKKKAENDEQYTEYFVRTAVLTSGGRKTEKVRESESEEEDGEKGDVFQMTDEDLFKACEGRTAHKGARHGLKALGKLARIAEQEAMLLVQPKYKGYSHAKNIKDKIQAVEEMNLNSDSEVSEHKKKKKKRKRCNSNEQFSTINNVKSSDCVLAQSIVESVPEKSDITDNDGVASVTEENGRKNKNREKKVDHEINEVIKHIEKPKKKKKRKSGTQKEESTVDAIEKVSSKKKRKKSID